MQTSIYIMLGRAAVALSICLTTATAAAQSATPAPTSVTPKTNLAANDVGKIYFNSARRDTGFGQLYKHKAVFDESIWGDLRFPDNVAPGTKVPAMVILHGSEGLSQHQYEWAAFFNQMGIAAFVVDSFGPRGIQSTTENQSQLTFAATAADGLNALKLLATHPRIDANRIGVTGYSRGGQGALTSSFEKVRSSVIDGDLKFALHIPFYAGCTQYGTTTGAPILVLAAEKDESVPIAACKVNEKIMKGLGADYKLIIYEGALHGFDSNYTKPIYHANGQTWYKCSIQIDFDRMENHIKGSEKAASPEEVRDYLKSCMTKGMSFGGNAEAYAKSRSEVKEFVIKSFGTVGQQQ